LAPRLALRKPSLSCLAVTKRAPTNSPWRHMRQQARRTVPLGFNTRTKISGTKRAPTSRQTPPSEMSAMAHSIQGASGSRMTKPGLRKSIRSCLRSTGLGRWSHCGSLS
jgi:hypothetical protein